MNRSDLAACPGCGGALRFLIFPAYYRAHAPAQSGEALMIDGESSCFYHPAKKASVPCDGCGRFLCALCDVELDAKHYCPRCLEAAKQKRTLNAIDNERYMYDSLAFQLAAMTLLLVTCLNGFVIFPGLAAIYLSIRHWNTPLSILPRSKARFVVAIILALIGMAIGLLVFGIFVFGMTQSP